ncbi:unnamed protein product [Mycena citricolor]|uniref:YTH domain-containing protein n=1 Tax=Mycena citricolor TaxID=2018698 RepID=A0AAD2JZI6_9AGAR|nr:unnamed protein product [Mycena citricolor]
MRRSRRAPRRQSSGSHASLAELSSDADPQSPTPTVASYPTRKPAVRRVYHPDAPINRSEWAMWVGNIPKSADETDIRKFFTQVDDHGVLSIVLLSKSSCAFVNLASEAHLHAAIEYGNGQYLRPEWSWGSSLVCRIRSLDDDLWTGVGGQRGMGLHRQWVKDRSVPGVDSESMEISEEDLSGAASDTSTTSSFFQMHFKRRFFVLKSQTKEELDRCAADGVWYIQMHNQVVLDKAFRTSEEVILFFSENKSGRFYGYARMSSRVLSTAFPKAPRMLPNPAAYETSPRLTDTALSPYPSPFGITQSAPNVLMSSPSTFDQRYRAGNMHRRSISLDQFSPRRIGDPERSTQPINRPELGSALRPESSTRGQQLGSDLSGQFTVDWLCLEPLPFKRTRNIFNPWNRGREIKISRDGTELEPGAGSALIHAWHASRSQ